MAVSARLRFEVLRRDAYRCRYCGTPACETRLTVDHVMPVTLGGADELGNLVACCPDCNAGKSSSLPEQQLVDTVARDAAEWETTKRRFAQQANAELDVVLSELEARFQADADGEQSEQYQRTFAERLNSQGDCGLSARAQSALASAWRVARAFHTYSDAVHDVLRSYPVRDVCDAAESVRAMFPEVEENGASLAEYRWYLVVTLLKKPGPVVVHKQRPPEVYTRYPQLDFMEKFVELLVQRMGGGKDQQEQASWAMWYVASRAFELYHFAEATNVGPETQLCAYETVLCELSTLYDAGLSELEIVREERRQVGNVTGGQ